MINRKKLVTKHNPKLTQPDFFSPLSVGNGNFVFTADITGLQSFNESYEDGMPLCTMSNWGWHTTPVSKDIYQYHRVGTIQPKYYETYGRKVGYYTDRHTDRPKYDLIRQNPHKFNLGKIGFVFSNDGKIADLTDINQELDLYTGILNSNYKVNGKICSVKTACDSKSDTIAVKAESELIAEKKMFIEIAFPYGSHIKNGSDWKNEGAHTSTLHKIAEDTYLIDRIMDRDIYYVFINSPVAIEVTQTSNHTFKVNAVEATNSLDVNIQFSTKKDSTANFRNIFANSEEFWKNYWEKGGMISFEGSTTPQANELERRMILSQYLTALQCGGDLPPAETGLTCNSWYGKFHLEMHFWHAAHFALFNRVEFLERSLKWYQDILPKAKELADSQGYTGARWPKMLGIDGEDSPSPIAPLLIWQQPHVILYCDWCYGAHKNDKEILKKYRDLVYETAEFMASYAVYDADNDRYILGPPVIPAQERHKAEECMNPTFELEYWIYGLETAINWLKELGEEIPERWVDVVNKLSKPTINNELYMAQENCPDTFERVNVDHPSMLGAYGMLNSQRIDTKIMSNTLTKVLECWDYPTLWGWDFSIMAMTATRLGRRQDALDILLKDTPKNIYSENGHNRQVLRNDLPLYLPGNGGLLLALGMMVAGYKGNSKVTPGFPDDGSWKIEYEDMNVLM